MGVPSTMVGVAKSARSRTPVKPPVRVSLVSKQVEATRAPVVTSTNVRMTKIRTCALNRIKNVVICLEVSSKKLVTCISYIVAFTTLCTNQNIHFLDKILNFPINCTHALSLNYSLCLKTTPIFKRQVCLYML